MKLPQTVLITSPIHHHISIYFYHKNYYAILKEYLQVLHKLNPKYFQVTLKKLSVLSIPLVEINTSLPLRFVLCTDNEILSIQKKEDMEKVQVNKNIFYYELSIKPNVDMLGITVYMRKQHKFETILHSNDVMNVKESIGEGFG